MVEHSLAISIAFLSFSAPLTASIVMRGRNGKAENNGHTNGYTNGKYVTTREYDAYKKDLGDRFSGLEKVVNELNNFVRSRL